MKLYDKKLFLTYRLLKRGAFLYLLLPILLFLFIFVRPVLAVLSGAVLVLCYLYGCDFLGNKKALFKKEIANEKKTGEEKIVPEEKKLSEVKNLPEERGIEISFWNLVIVGVLCILWCFFGGQGGFFYQNTDWNERNAIFRDLIRLDYPIYYASTDTILSYYIGHWLPAAFLAKIFLRITKSLELAWLFGRILLWIWTALGCYISYYLVALFVKPKRRSGWFFLFILFVMFSGLDIIGCEFFGWAKDYVREMPHLEPWTGYLQFSCNTTCLFWVYNQAVPAWVATLCFLNEKNCKNYVYIFTCTLVSSTLPCIGIFVLMVSTALVQLLNAMRNKQVFVFMKTTFSLSNILMTIGVFPLVALYYMTNTEVGNMGEKNGLPSQTHPVIYMIIGTCILLLIITLVLNIRSKCRNRRFFMYNPVLAGGMLFLMSMIVTLKLRPGIEKVYFAFILLEVGVYLLLIFKDYIMDPLFYIISCSLALAPGFVIGYSEDFCMRSSIPALLVLMCLVSKKLLSERHSLDECVSGKKASMENSSSENCRNKPVRKAAGSLSTILLVICLCIGACTPFVEFYRGCKNVAQKQKIALVEDNIYTLDKYRPDGGIYSNFLSKGYENSVFYKYIMNRGNSKLEEKRKQQPQ